MKVLIPFADGMEEMEAIILTDVLRRGGVEVTTTSLLPDQCVNPKDPDSPKQAIKASRNTFHLADTYIGSMHEKDFATFSMILLPGGLAGTENLEKSIGISRALAFFQKEKKWIGAICAAPRVLLKHGILQPGDEYTAYPGATQEGPGYSGKPVQSIPEKKIITGKGPGTAFELALAILEILVGRDKTLEVKNGLQFAH